jgi:hypothetical protein
MKVTRTLLFGDASQMGSIDDVLHDLAENAEFEKAQAKAEREAIEDEKFQAKMQKRGMKGVQKISVPKTRAAV